MADYYDKQGKPIGAIELCNLRMADHYSRVGRTAVGSSRISTVWLGLDHQYGNGTPLIFETMVFGGALHGECKRYSTEAEAIAGHAVMVARVMAAQAADRATQIQA